VCKIALTNLHEKAKAIGAADPNHYVFPRHGKNQKIDPTQPMVTWRTAWRSIRRKAARNDAGDVIYPNLERVRFHDGRHTAITTLAEKGLPDWVIQAQVGHVDPQMMKTYSHIRRRALDEAAAALEPTAKQQPTELIN
jgi:integrase